MSKRADLISVAEAIQRISQKFQRMPGETVPLEVAPGRVAAAGLASPEDIPAFTTSAMDGYAVRAADLQSATADKPCKLRITADIPAGFWPAAVLGEGEAMRISTGAPLPEGADAVVPIEDIIGTPDDAGRPLPESIAVPGPAEPGAYLRPAGQDARKGDQVIAAGTLLGASEIGMLARLGLAEVDVCMKPRVAIFSTGDELVRPGQPLSPGKIRDSNGPSLSAAVNSAGGSAHYYGIVPDDREMIRQLLDTIVSDGADLILSTAGVSVGAFDYVRAVIEDSGALDFWRINMRPGKPLAFGAYREVPYFGLPGNPVSALVTFEVIVRQAIARMLGQTGDVHLKLRARLEEAVLGDGRESYLRGILREQNNMYYVRLTGGQDSGMLSSLIQADVLVVVPAGTRRLEQGDEVSVIMWI
jgi:molybdopterin molybdotransferase